MNQHHNYKNYIDDRSIHPSDDRPQVSNEYAQRLSYQQTDQKTVGRIQKRNGISRQQTQFHSHGLQTKNIR